MENFHLTRIGDEWHLVAETADQATMTFPSKDEALKGSADYLEGRTASLKIHGDDGEIEDEWIYQENGDSGE